MLELSYVKERHAPYFCLTFDFNIIHLEYNFAGVRRSVSRHYNILLCLHQAVQPKSLS
jgi:hypothetical protein